jgi:general secretion pathway protein D
MMKPRVTCVCMLVTLACLAGCKSGGDPVAETEVRTAPPPAAPYDASTRPVSEQLGVRAVRDPLPSGGLVDYVVLDPEPRDSEPVGFARLTPEMDNDVRRPIRMTLNAATPAEVIHALAYDVLGRQYLLDPALSVAPGTISLLVDEEMTDRDVVDLLGILSEIHGWSIDERDGTFVFTQLQRSAKNPSLDLLEHRSALDSPESAMRIFRPRYISSSDAFKVVEPLLSEGATGIVSGRVLLVADRISQLNRIGGVIRAVDSAPFEGTQVWTYRLNHADPGRVAQTLTQVIQSAGFGNIDGAPAVAVVPIPDLRYLMVISRDPTARQALGDWVEMLDRAPVADERRWFIYKAQSTDVKRLQSVLQEIFADRVSTAVDGETKPGDIRLIADQDTETLLAHASPHDYAQILDFLARLDRSPQQVLLTATIASIELSEGLEFGVEAFLTEEFGGNIVDAFLNPANNFGPTNPLGTASVVGASGLLVVRALQERTDVTILSRPRVFVRDGDTANFRVGGEVPVLSASVDSNVQADGNTGIRNEIEYREIGILIRVQPQINERGEITLNVEQEITDVIPNTTSGIDSPQFTTRELDTTVVLTHGQTVLLAGFIEQRKTDQTAGLPLLSDIPVLGWPFRNTSQGDDRTELILSITPTIVNDASQADAVYQRMTEQAAVLREALNEFNDGPYDVITPEAADDGMENG